MVSSSKNKIMVIQAQFQCVKISDKHKRLQEGCGDTTDILKQKQVWWSWLTKAGNSKKTVWVHESVMQLQSRADSV